MNVFTDIKIQPAYGFEQVLINWTTLPAYADGDVYVYRSQDGVEISDSWELLNGDSPVVANNYFIDTTLDDKNGFRHYYYRLVLYKNEAYYDSPIVGMFSEGLNKTEYGILRYMRKMEYLRMRSRNGVRILHCIPLVSGELSNNTDDVLKSRLGSTCKIGDKDDPQLYEGTGIFYKEFSSVFQTWAEITSISAINVTPLEESVGNKLTQQYKLRLLGFPCPEIGHMLVLPQTDKRLSITDNITPYYFKGYLPVAYDVVAEEIPRTESRYKIPLPQLLNDPVKPVTFDRAL